MRLVNGTAEWNGRLEVCHKGHWGAVCETRFEDVDALVVCRQLGFTSESKQNDSERLTIPVHVDVFPVAIIICSYCSITCLICHGLLAT